jgi:hypothetical protein
MLLIAVLAAAATVDASSCYYYYDWPEPANESAPGAGHPAPAPALVHEVTESDSSQIPRVSVEDRGADPLLCSASCPLRPLTGFLRREGNTIVDEDGSPFRFLSVNVPNLHRIEKLAPKVERVWNFTDHGSCPPELPAVTGETNVVATLPTAGEIWDALCSARQMGGAVVRSYVLAAGDGPRFHVSGVDADCNLRLEEPLFLVLDQVVATAESLGLRVIVPFINTIHYEDWGSIHTYSRWVGVDPAKFHETPRTLDLYDQLVTRVLLRNNTITKSLYRDSPAIIWELGNELVDPAALLTSSEFGRDWRTLPPPPVEWRQRAASLIKSLAPRQLVMDGAAPKAQFVEEIDLLGSTDYTSSTQRVEKEAARAASMGRPYVLKEFGILDAATVAQPEEHIRAFTRLIAEGSLTGALYWSLRSHARTGGFYHWYETAEVTALHWPGFHFGPQDGRTIFDTLSETALSLPGSPPAPTEPPCSPVLRSSTPGSLPCLSFVGSTGADRYHLYMRARRLDGSVENFTLVSRDMSDQHVPEEAFATLDANTFYYAHFWYYYYGLAEHFDRTYDFCLEACGPAGCSPCSAPVQTVAVLGAAVAKECATVEFDAPYVAATGYEWTPYSIDVTPAGIPQVFAAVAGLTLAAFVHTLRCLGISPQSWLRREGKAAVVDVPDNRVLALDALRALGVAHFVIAWQQGTPTWADAELDAGILVSGFLLARARAAGRAASVSVCVERRLRRLLPPFWGTLLIIPFLSETLDGEYSTMAVALHTWRRSLRFENAVNSASWIVGAMVMNAAVFLPLARLLEQNIMSHASRRAAAALVLYLCTAWQALNFAGRDLLFTDAIGLNWVAFAAHVPTFALGVLAGLEFGARPPKSTCAWACFAFAAVAGLACIFSVPLASAPAWVRA